jgi:pyrroline-5-carboxylate reductase
MSVRLTGNLVLIGAGKMGGAMMQGWLEAGVPPGQIVVLDPGPPPEVAELISANGIRHNPPVDDLEDVSVVLAAVKPQIMDDVLSGLSGLKRHKPLVLSIAAGKTIASFEAHFGADAAVIRSIPNTPSAVGRGITAITANGNVSEVQMALAEGLLASIGEVVRVADEGLIDAATAVSGSGPAYVFYMTECLAAAGVKAGLPGDVAMQLARATVAGAGELMRQSGIEASTLRENVTSPNGTTYAALQVLMADDGLQPLMEKAVAAAKKRSAELAG